MGVMAVVGVMKMCAASLERIMPYVIDEQLRIALLAAWTLLAKVMLLFFKEEETELVTQHRQPG